MNSESKLSIDDWRILAELYEKGEKLPPAEYQAFLNSVQTDHPHLVSELLTLLAQANEIDTFLANPFSIEALPEPAGALVPIFKPEEVIADFKIVTILGRGAFGTVYLANQLSLDRLVALKITPNKGAEARTMAQIEHQGIVPVYSETVIEKPSMRLICMAYIPGLSMEKIGEAIKSGAIQSPITGEKILNYIAGLLYELPSLNPNSLKTREQFSEFTVDQLITAIGINICNALSYAHTKGILHLDIKPGNIIIDFYGNFYLTDFNVAISKQMDDALRIDSFGGTFAYMSPEQKKVFNSADLQNAVLSLDARSDVYSLGLLLKKWGTISNASPRFDPIIERAIAENPEERYGSVTDFQSALRIQQEMLDFEMRLPKVAPWMEKCMSKPLLALTAFGALPQIIAVIIGTRYNQIQVFSQLSVEQEKIFHALNSTYTPLMYVLLGGLWTAILWSVYSSNRKNGPDISIDTFRRNALKLPFWGMLMSTLGWLPSALIYPIAISYYSEAISRPIIIHLLISFTLSWLIAMAYSFLFHHVLVLRFIYPKAWGFKEIPSKTVNVELKYSLAWCKKFLAVTGVIPLIGAVILLNVGPGNLDSNSFYQFKNLTITLIAFGVLGFAFAQIIYNKAAQTIRALSQNSK